MNHRELNPDQTIDRLLTGLRDAKPPQGMERRILETAHARAVERGSWMVAALTGAWRWAIAGAGVLALLLLATVALHRKSLGRHEVAGVTRNVSPQATASVPPLVEEARTSHPGRGSVPVSRWSRATRAKPEPLSEEDALALSEMNAPSRPAPPLPLTRQEKLLAEAVHQARPEELSSLRSEVKARQMELSKAEFHDFFEPPSAKNNE